MMRQAITSCISGMFSGSKLPMSGKNYTPYILLGVSAAVLLFGVIFAFRFKR